MKQTAVQWLVEQILTQVQDYEDGDVETELEPFKTEYVNKYIGMVDLSKFVIKALEMEKEQIRDSFNSGMDNSEDYFHPFLEPNDESENYYNETYETKTN